MKRSDLIELEKIMMKEVVKRRQLGGYSPDAEGILTISETVMRMLQYMIDEYPEEAEAAPVVLSNTTKKRAK